MTDYEIVDLMQSHVSSVGEVGTYLVTGVFAFIIACYLTAKRLNTAAFVGLLLIYLPYAIIQLVGLYTNLRRLESILNAAASRETLTKEIELFSEAAMTGTEYFVIAMTSYFTFAVVASLVFGLLIKTGKLDI